MRELLLVGAGTELVLAAAALLAGGPMALVAALVGSAVAMGAQVVAVALLRPAMRAEQRTFTRRWVAGVGVRFASFLVVAVLLFTLNAVLPPGWLAAGYVFEMLVLLLGETWFLR